MQIADHTNRKCGTSGKSNAKYKFSWCLKVFHRVLACFSFFACLWRWLRRIFPTMPHAMAGAGTFYGIRGSSRSEAGCEQMEWLCWGLGGTGGQEKTEKSVVFVSVLLGHAGARVSIQCTQDHWRHWMIACTENNREYMMSSERLLRRWYLAALSPSTLNRVPLLSGKCCSTETECN
jgi:hypothetical protein